MSEKLPMKDKNDQIELSIVLPCLNEEQTVGVCVAKAVQFLRENKVNGEVILADNGSIDLSIEIAKKEGAVITNVEQMGYGMALRGGFSVARGKYIIMADSDDSRHFKA
jgi:glycosyltransferase involved in cell wall biosynthesis